MYTCRKQRCVWFFTVLLISRQWQPFCLLAHSTPKCQFVPVLITQSYLYNLLKEDTWPGICVALSGKPHSPNQTKSYDPYWLWRFSLVCPRSLGTMNTSQPFPSTSIPIRGIKSCPICRQAHITYCWIRPFKLRKEPCLSSLHHSSIFFNCL